MTSFLLALILFVQAAPSGGAITGRLLRLDGKPASGVRVWAIEVTEGNGPSTIAGSTDSGPDGLYRIDGVPSGRYRIAAGFLDLPSYHPGVDEEQKATIFTVQRGATIQAIQADFRLTRLVGATVRGQVSLPPGPAVALDRYTVRILSGAVSATTKVAPDGSFAFLRVPPGRYVASVSPDRRPSTANFVVEDTDVAVEIPAPMLYTGRVTVDDGKPLPSIAGAPSPRITLNSSPAGDVSSDGAFQFDPANGSQVLRIQGLPFGYFVQSIIYDGKNLLKEAMDVTNRPATEIRIGLTRMPPAKAVPGVQVKGRVTNVPSGLTPEAFGVVLTGGPEERVGATRVRPDGTWEIEEVEPGAYGVRAFSMQPGALSGYSVSQRLQVEARGKDGVDVPLLFRVEFSGRVQILGAAGPRTSIPSGAAVEFTRVGDSQAAQAPYAVIAGVQPGGQFGPVALVSGEYTVRLSGLPAGVTVKSLALGGTDLLKKSLIIGAAPADGVALTVELATKE